MFYLAASCLGISLVVLLVVDFYLWRKQRDKVSPEFKRLWETGAVEKWK